MSTSYRIVVLGDGGVGKTSLTIQTYDPTVEDRYKKQVLIEGQDIYFEVLDTAGQEEYTALTDQWIRDGEGFLLVYSVTDRFSFLRMEHYYHQVLLVKDVSYCPIVIVGNKADLNLHREVNKEEGLQQSKKLQTDGFYEVSAKIYSSVEKPFLELARRLYKFYPPKSTNLKINKKKSKKCTIL